MKDMKDFLDDDFLLGNEMAKTLYARFASRQPIVDYHCHISPQEIYEDRRFDNLADVWLGGRNDDGSYFGDHYKWRVMRSAGIPERLITGRENPVERIEAFAKALELAIGNPMYHWCNLELKRFFGVEKPFTPENAKEIYEHCTKMLREDPGLSVRGLIRRSNVRFIGTTDDPIDTLRWHEKLAADPTADFKVCPSFRPDKAINIGKAGFEEYMKLLAQSVKKEAFSSAREVCDALSARAEYFAAHGCRASDHGLDYIPYRPCTMQQADAIFCKKMRGERLTIDEIESYQTALLLCLGETYHRLDIAMELHYSCIRNNNARCMAQMGPDTGFDMIGSFDCIGAAAQLLSALDEKGCCPKTILFSLNPADNAQIDTLIGCFQTDELPGKLQHGAAWWFNDTKSGMEEQMRSLANLGLLGTFIGMLTDSRSFLSYTRHEYFRRILCNFVGQLVENGEYPNDMSSLEKIINGICYTNAERYFHI